MSAAGLGEEVNRLYAERLSLIQAYPSMSPAEAACVLWKLEDGGPMPAAARDAVRRLTELEVTGDGGIEDQLKELRAERELLEACFPGQSFHDLEVRLEAAIRQTALRLGEEP